MSSLRIPQDLKKGFEDLVHLDLVKFEALLKFVSSVDSITNLDIFRKELAAFLAQLSENEGLMEDVIISLASLKVRYPEKDAASDLYRSFLEIAESSDITEDVFVDRINKIIKSIRQIIVFFKKNLLKSSNERNYVNGEIITDLRFVFGTDLDSSERKAIIIHNLKLEIEDSKESSDIYITLDIDDLKELRSCIERAIAKEELIKKDYIQQITFI